MDKSVYFVMLLKNTTHRTRHAYQLFGFAIGLLAVFGATYSASAQWVDPSFSSYNGFSVWRADYVGVSATCTATQTEFQYRLRDAVTMGPLSSPADLQIRFIHGDGVNDTFTPWQYVTNSSLLSVCVDENHFLGAEVWAGNNSVYQGGREWTIRADSSVTRAGERGQHYYKDIYLNPRTNSARTATPIFPINLSTLTNPAVTFELNAIPNLGGATGVRAYTVSFINYDTGEKITAADVTVRGGVGQYVMAPQALSEGFMRWIAMFKMNGTSTMSGGPFSSYPEIPKTNFSRTWIPFILDQTPPLTTLATNVTAINSIQDNVTLTASIYDYHSGPSVTSLIIENIDTGAVTQIDRSFPLHADGFYSANWGDNIDVTATVTLDHFTNYRVFAMTSDVVGHITMTPAQYLSHGNSGSDTSVLVQNPHVTLSAFPTSLAEGDTTTLTWTTRRATDCTAAGGTWNGNKDAAGGLESVTVLASATYQLLCTNASGSDTASADVTATPPIVTVPPIITLNATPQIIRRNETTTLTWSIEPTTDVTDCRISGAADTSVPVGVADNLTTNNIMSQRTITLSCNHPTGTISESVTIQVIPQLFEQ